MSPWRCHQRGALVTSSAAPDLMPNAETWLDFTDLVLHRSGRYRLQPLSSRPATMSQAFFSIDGDVNSIAVTIRRWLGKVRPPALPKFCRR